MRTRIRRIPSQSSSPGTTTTAAVLPGFETMPTVSIGCIEQELAIPFSAEDRALHQCRAEPECFDGGFNSGADFGMQSGVSDDSASAHLAATGLELPLYQHNEFAG